MTLCLWQLTHPDFEPCIRMDASVGDAKHHYAILLDEFEGIPYHQGIAVIRARPMRRELQAGDLVWPVRKGTK